MRCFQIAAGVTAFFPKYCSHDVHIESCIRVDCIGDDVFSFVRTVFTNFRCFHSTMSRINNPRVARILVLLYALFAFVTMFIDADIRRIKAGRAVSIVDISILGPFLMEIVPGLLSCSGRRFY